MSDYDKKKEKWLKVEKELVAGACMSALSFFCLEVIPLAVASVPHSSPRSSKHQDEETTYILRNEPPLHLEDFTTDS
jgi:hypothetical protein